MAKEICHSEEHDMLYVFYTVGQGILRIDSSLS